MKKILAIALVGLMATGANAAMLSLVDMTPGSPHAGSLSGPADPMVLDVSEVGVVGIVLELWYDGVIFTPETVRGANLFLDSVAMTGVGGTYAEAVGAVHDTVYPGTEYLEVVDVTRAGDAEFVWTGQRAYDVDPMGELQTSPLPHGDGIGLDQYYLVADMAVGAPLEGAADGAPAVQYVLDMIDIHGTAEGASTIWFENAYTFQPAIETGTLRDPTVFPRTGSQMGITALEGAASGGALGFYNGFIKLKGSGAVLFEREGYWVNVVPEPASLALLALGGLALLRRRN